MTIAPEGNRRPTFSMGDRLRKARELTGLEKQVFAEQIGIHRDSLTKYESDRQAPRPPVLMAWALATGVDLEWLKTGAEEESSGPRGGGSGQGRLRYFMEPPVGFEPTTPALQERCSGQLS